MRQPNIIQFMLKLRRRLVFCVLALLAAALPARDLIGRAVVPGIDYEATKVAAQKGDARALYDLALCYEQGREVKQDYSKAADYLLQSAEKGYTPAEVRLGSFFGRGLGVQKDMQQAINWYRKAAEQGDPLAQYAMGSFCSIGRGVPKDVSEAMEWCGGSRPIKVMPRLKTRWDNSISRVNPAIRTTL